MTVSIVQRMFTASAIAALLCTPLTVRALTSADIDAQIRILLEQVTTLQTKIQQYTPSQGTTVAPTTTIVPTSSSATGSKVCPTLTRTLSLGMSGVDVTDLQRFLVTEGVLTQSSASGYFDLSTELAVQRWQVKHGIVSSGTAATTGYGAVGPRTRTLIALNCSLGPQVTTLTPRTASDPAPVSCPVAPPPTSICASGWRAVTDAYGCTTSYTCSVASSGNTNTSSVTSSGQFSIVSPIAGLSMRGGNFLYISWNRGSTTGNYIALDLVTEAGAVMQPISVLPFSGDTHYWWTIPSGVNSVWPGRYKIRATVQSVAIPFCSASAACTVLKTADSGVFTITQ